MSIRFQRQRAPTSFRESVGEEQFIGVEKQYVLQLEKVRVRGGVTDMSQEVYWCPGEIGSGRNQSEDLGGLVG